MIGRAMRPVLFLALLLLPAVAAAGFEEGVDAYLRGEYARARTEWTPLAERGNAQAAYNLGRMRELGLDGPADAAAAARWYHEAAERGHGEAQRALAQLLAEGKGELDAIVEKSLRRAGLWDEVKDRLSDSGTALSGGQQQRLCIARAIAVDPEVILMDEPCSALDPIATAKIEELIHELRGRYAIVIVTHNMQQAARVSHRAAFFHLGQLVEYGVTDDIFTNPRQERTKDYITGRYG